MLTRDRRVIESRSRGLEIKRKTAEKTQDLWSDNKDSKTKTEKYRLVNRKIERVNFIICYC